MFCTVCISRELLLNNNCLRVLPYELGRLFQLQTLGLKGEAFFEGLYVQNKHAIFLIRPENNISFAGNPLSQDILNLYQEPDGTRKLLNYMLDNLAGNNGHRYIVAY